jgi:Phage integrase, N-terminal SAM-like domain
LNRFFIGKGRYAETKLGMADDATDAEGVAILDYRQAQAAARAWFAEQARKGAGLGPAHAGPYTVADALADYLAWYSRHRKALTNTKLAADARIQPTLGSKPIAKLTPSLLQDWLNKLADAAPRRA